MKYFLIICTIFLLNCKNESEKETKPIIRQDINTTSTEELNFKKGKKFFSSNCASCHSDNMYQKMTAPALGGITLRREKKWLYKYTRNSIRMYDKGDSISVQLRIEYNHSLMPSFNFTDKDLDAIYFYVEKRYAERQQ